MISIECSKHGTKRQVLTAYMREEIWLFHCSDCCRESNRVAECEERVEVRDLSEEEQAWLVIQGSMRS